MLSSRAGNRGPGLWGEEHWQEIWLTWLLPLSTSCTGISCLIAAAGVSTALVVHGDLASGFHI